MACLPYPTFHSIPTKTNDTQALSCVGRVRIHPLTCPGVVSTSDADDAKTRYDAILRKTVLQSQTASDTTESKQLRKKYMKQSVSLASSYLKTNLGIDASVVDVEIVLPVRDVVRSDGCICACFLDAGCDRIVLEVKDDDDEKSTWKDVCTAADAARLPEERMMIHFVRRDLFDAAFDDHRDVIGERFGYVSVFTERDLETMTRVSESICAKDGRFKFVLQLSRSIPDDDEDDTRIIREFAKSAKENSGRITLLDPTVRQLGLSYASCLKTDRTDGLYATVVCNRSNEALGLVYSSGESIVAALQSGRGVYYSRSRNSLWRKGDTSGNYQTLHRIDADCDGDALRFTVTQEGEEEKAFCHLNTLTCWGEPRGLRHLEGVLQRRLGDAPEGSYTKRLFEDEELLRDKLVEEAQELSEADTKEDVAGELADVIYFAMVRAVKAGVSIDDAVMELDRRARKVTRRQGDSKAFRIQAGNEILSKKDDW